MSDSVVVIYKFLTLTKELSYFVSYEAGNAKHIADMSFGEFIEKIKNSRLAWTFGCAKRIAIKYERQYNPEFYYFEYDGYLNVFFEAQESHPTKEFRLVPKPDFDVVELEENTKETDNDTAVDTNDDTNCTDNSNYSSEEFEVILKKLELCDEKISELRTQLEDINNMSMLQLFWNRVWHKKI
jgi:hypothetical protein